MIGKVFAQKRAKLGGAQCLDVEWIRLGCCFFVNLNVGDRDHKHAIGAQNSLDRTKKLLLVGDMFERLERDDHIHRSVRKRYGNAIPEHERYSGATIVARCMANSLWRSVDAEDLLCHYSQQRAAV